MARDFGDEWLQETSDTLVRAQVPLSYTFRSKLLTVQEIYLNRCSE
jgi:hypothetical protein